MDIEITENVKNEIAYRKKILAIRKASHVNKDMNVTMGAKGSYKALSEAGVLNKLQPLLDEHLIDVVCTDVVEVNSSATHFKAIYTYRFIDCESGYCEYVKYAGSGTDRSDKDTGKAGTYAFKNMLVKRFFMISGEDTENESSDMQHSNINNELNTNIIKLRQKGYFNSPSNNPRQTKEGEVSAFNEFMGRVNDNKDDVPWLMEKNNQILGMLGKSR